MRTAAGRHLPFMEALGVPYEVHMFVDTLNAPPDAIGGTTFRVAEQLGASLIVTTTDCYVSVEHQNSQVDPCICHVACSLPQSCLWGTDGRQQAHVYGAHDPC